MALSGLHVLCAFAGRAGAPDSQQALLKDFQWSETLASAGTTTQSVVASNAMAAVFRVRSSADAFVAVGEVPNASLTVSTDKSSARMFVAAGVDYDIYAPGKSKLAWVAA